MFVPGGTTSQISTISLSVDSLFEEDESFIVSITSVSFSNVTPMPSSVTVTILDDDGMLIP